MDDYQNSDCPIGVSELISVRLRRLRPLTYLRSFERTDFDGETGANGDLLVAEWCEL